MKMRTTVLPCCTAVGPSTEYTPTESLEAYKWVWWGILHREVKFSLFMVLIQCFTGVCKPILVLLLPHAITKCFMNVSWLHWSHWTFDFFLTQSCKTAHLFSWSISARQYPYQLLMIVQNVWSSFQLLAPIPLAMWSLCGYTGLYLITTYVKVLDGILLLCVSETLLIQMYFLKTKYVIVS